MAEPDCSVSYGRKAASEAGAYVEMHKQSPSMSRIVGAAARLAWRIGIGENRHLHRRRRGMAIPGSTIKAMACTADVGITFERGRKHAKRAYQMKSSKQRRRVASSSRQHTFLCQLLRDVLTVAGSVAARP